MNNPICTFFVMSLMLLTSSIAAAGEFGFSASITTTPESEPIRVTGSDRGECETNLLQKIVELEQDGYHITMTTQCVNNALGNRPPLPPFVHRYIFPDGCLKCPPETLRTQLQRDFPHFFQEMLERVEAYNIEGYQQALAELEKAYSIEAFEAEMVELELQQQQLFK